MSADNLVRSQAALLRQLHLRLMPEVPASRPKLYDVVAPSVPPMDDLLAAAEHAMQAALTQIEADDREAAAGHHQQAQTAFEKLAEIANWRMEAMTKRARMKVAVTISEKQAAQLLTLEERLIALLELVYVVGQETKASREIQSHFRLLSAVAAVALTAAT